MTGGVADRDGHVMPGDQILSVNDVDLRNANQEIAAALLKVRDNSVSCSQRFTEGTR